MPLQRADTPEVVGIGQVDLNPTVEEVEVTAGPDFFAETVPAAFRQSNVIGSYLNDATRGVDLWEPEKNGTVTDPWPQIQGTKYEPLFDRFAETRNQAAIDLVKRQIDSEMEDRKTLESAGALGFVADLAMQFTDPTILIPGGTIYRAGKYGFTIARSAASVAAATAAGTAVQETMLNQTQQVRTPLEGALNVTGATIVGGMFGAAGGAILGRKALADLGKVLDAAGERTGTQFDVPAGGEGPSSGSPAPGGAAAAEEVKASDYQLAGRAARATQQVTSAANLSLNADLMTSPSGVVRQAASRMLTQPYYLERNMRGLGELAVEDYVVRADALAAGAIEDVRSLYRTYRKSGGLLKENAFLEEAGKAARNNDQALNGDPYISQAAERWRKVTDEIKREAIEVGRLPEDIAAKFADSYLHRMYNRQKLISQEPEFKRDVLRPWAEQKIAGAEQMETDVLDKRTANLDREIQDLEMQKLRRSSEAEERARGGEAVDLEGVTEQDILTAVREVQTARVPKVETLTSYLRRTGVYDPDGELAALGITPRTAPGFVRKMRRTSMDPTGGVDLDTAARMAWEEGFLPGQNRPDIRELLDALGDDFNKTRLVVRESDQEIAQRINNITQIEAALNRMGVDIDSPRFGTTEDMKNLVGKVRKEMDAKADARIKDLKAKIANLKTDYARQREAFFEGGERTEYTSQIIDNVFNNMVGRTDMAMANDFKIAPNNRGPLKNRLLDIDDNVLEPWLENNIEVVNRRYARMMSAEIELTRKFGSADLKDLIGDANSGIRGQIGEDYDKLRALAKTEKDLRALDKREKNDIKEIRAARDILRGMYGAEWESEPWARVIRTGMIWNSLRAMGGVVVTSLADAARPLMTHGLGPYMRYGVAPLFRGLKGIKASAQEGRYAGIAEMVLNNRMATVADLANPYAQNTAFERMMDRITTGFFKYNGFQLWNDWQKQFAFRITSNRILDLATGSRKISKKDRDYLSMLGMQDDMLERIAAQYQKYHSVEDGVKIANAELWKDVRAARTFQAGAVKDVNGTIITKGVGDTALWMRHPVGQALLQFRGFALAAHQRAMIRGMQEADANVMGGLVAMASIGMFVEWIKAWESNRQGELPGSENPGFWIAAGLDRTGVFPLMFEAFNTFEKTGTAPGIYTIMQMGIDPDERETAGRYKVRSPIDALGGPSIGLFADIQRVLGLPYKYLRGDDFTEGDVNAAARLLPGRSLPGIRSGLEYFALEPAREAVSR